MKTTLVIDDRMMKRLKVEAARQEDRDRWQAEVAQLGQALADRQEQCHRADQDHREATAQIQTLETELRQLRARAVTRTNTSGTDLPQES